MARMHVLSLLQVIVVLSASCAVALAEPAPEIPDRLKDVLSEAKSHYDAGRLPQAIALYDDVLSEVPDLAAALVARGACRMKLNEFQPAIMDFTRAIELDPDNHAAYGARATAWANVKRPDKALPDFDQIIRLRPNDANSYVVRGVTKANLGKPLAALADIEVALSLDPGNAKTHVVRGMIWQAVKQFAAARIAFESAVRADAASLEGHNKLALLLVTCSDASVRDYKRGIQHAQECCKLTDYKQWQHLAMLGTAYAQAGQFPEAIKWQQSAVDSAPAEAQPALQQRLALYREGKTFYKIASPPPRTTNL